MPEKLPPLKGDPFDNAEAFLTKALEWMRAAGISGAVIQKQLLATAVAAHVTDNGVEATARWLEDAAQKVRLNKPPAGRA